MRYRSRNYMDTVKSHPCLICGGEADPHHVRITEKGGMGLKVGDNNCVPICRMCHNELHNFGNEEAWWALKGVDPLRWMDWHWGEYSKNTKE